MSDSNQSIDDCSCCKTGVSAPTVFNRPGLSALVYRVRTHAACLEAMKAGLSGFLDFELPELDEHGKPKTERIYPLRGLTTRETDDPAIALLDAWATVADVLTFYQERIANEGYLRTATERRSVLELARAIGYELKPGVAASTYLAFTVETAPGAPRRATIEVGTKVLSIPGQNERPQTFETVEKIEAKAEWNGLKLRQTETQEIKKGVKNLYLKGVSTKLQPGDGILLVGDDRDSPTGGGNERWDFRILQTVTEVRTSDPEQSYTEVTWESGLGHEKPTVDPASNPRAFAFRQRAALFGYNAPDWRTLPDSVKDDFATDYPSYTDWPNFEIKISENNEIDLDAVYPKILVGSWIVLRVPAYTELYKLTAVSNGSRKDFGLTAKTTRVGLDTLEHLTWCGLRDTVVFCQSERLELAEKPIAQPLYGDRIILGELMSDLQPSQTLIVSGKRVRVKIDSAAQGLKLLSSDGLKSVDLKANDLLQVLAPPVLPVGTTSEQDIPLKPEELIQVLNSMVPQLIKWRLMDRDGFVGLLTALSNAVSLEGAAKEDATLSEVAFIDKAKDAVSSDRDRTTLILQDPLENCYDRLTVSINANVAKATHGETVAQEVLGSGDGSQANQRFVLKKPPLTYVSATTGSGGQSTLTVRVNGVAWQEVPSLYELDRTSESFTVRIDNEGKASVIFGDGEKGARLPSGTEKVTATYRSGTGPEGEVAAGKLTLLQTRPLGIREVANPIAASGADAPESLENARENAPLNVLTLERIVSLEDFEDFSRAFLGVGKAQAVSLWNGETHLVNITVGTAAGKPIDPKSDLYTHLLEAIDSARDPIQPVMVAGYIPRTFSLEASVVTDSRYVDEDVFAQARTLLLENFSFGKRAFGQPVTAAEVVAMIQAVPGVVAVDLDSLSLDPVEDTQSSISDLEVPAILMANQVKLDLKTGNIQLTELLLINVRGVNIKKKKETTG